MVRHEREGALPLSDSANLSTREVPARGDREGALLPKQSRLI